MLKMPGQILKYQIVNVTTFIIILFITLDVLNTGWLSRVYALVAGLIIGTLLGLRYLKFNFQKDFIQNDFFKSIGMDINKPLITYLGSAKNISTNEANWN